MNKKALLTSVAILSLVAVINVAEIHAGNSHFNNDTHQIITESFNIEKSVVKNPEEKEEDEKPSEDNAMYVVVDRLKISYVNKNKKIEYDIPNRLYFRQKIEVFETRKDPDTGKEWVKITKDYTDPNSGNKISQWVAKRFLSTNRPSNPADTASGEWEEVVKNSYDFRHYRKEFAEAAKKLVNQGKCSKQQIIDNGGFCCSVNKEEGNYFIDFGKGKSNRWHLNVKTGKMKRG